MGKPSTRLIDGHTVVLAVVEDGRRTGVLLARREGASGPASPLDKLPLGAPLPALRSTRGLEIATSG